MKRITKFFYCLAGLILIAYGFATYDLLFWGRVPSWLGMTQIIYGCIVGFVCTVAIGFWLFAKGVLSRRRLPRLSNEREGGIVSISPKALRNITYTAVEHFDGVLTDRVRVRILRGKTPSYRIKVWLGIAEYSTLPAQHEAIRRHIGEALFTATGLPVSRVDLVFYTAHKESARLEEGGAPQ